MVESFSPSVVRKSNIIKNAQKRVDDLKRLQKAGLICLDGDFSPSVHYPPITKYHPINEKALFEIYFKAKRTGSIEGHYF